MADFKSDDDRTNPDLVDNTNKEILEHQEPRITKVEVTPSQANLQPGDSVEVTITTQPPEAEAGDIEGVSDAEGVATVSGKTVTAVSVGAANVRFADKGSGLGASILIEVFEEDEDEEEKAQDKERLQRQSAPVSAQSQSRKSGGTRKGSK